MNAFESKMKPAIEREIMSAIYVLATCAIPIVCTIGCRSVNHFVATVPNFNNSKRIDVQCLVPLDEIDSIDLSSPVQTSIEQVSFKTPPNDELSIESISPTGVEQNDEWTLSQLIAEVHSVNPTLEAMTAAWNAAIQRIPQATSLEDPMLGSTVAPASLVSSQVDPAYALEISQKLPWHGKRSLRGASARADAGIASHNFNTARQKLTEVIELEFWDLYSSESLMKLNTQNSGILKSIRENAEIRYRTGLVMEQDVLQADVEITNLEVRLIELDRMNRVAKGNLNALLRRNPNDILTIASEQIVDDEPLAELDSLIRLAVARRPEVSANRMQIQGDRTRVELARKRFYPDGEIFYRHDTFWQPRTTQSDLREQVGVRMNMPIYHKRLNAEVCETIQKLAKSQAEYDQLLLDIQRDVQVSWEQILETQKKIDLYAKKLIPTAENNVSVVRSNYDNSKSTFVELAIAQRQWIEFKERLLMSQIELKRRTVVLSRIVGGSLSRDQENR